MIFDKPAQVVWVASLTATGYVNSNFIKVIDNEQSSANVINRYTDTGYLNSSTSNYYTNTTSVLYSITDNNFNSNLSNFVWSFSGYKGPIYSTTAMLAVNYFNNYTANSIDVIINSNNQTLSPPFYLDPYSATYNPTDSKTFSIPAGAQNFPIPLWVRPSQNNSSVSFNCTINTSPPVTITGSAIFTA